MLMVIIPTIPVRLMLSGFAKHITKKLMHLSVW